jgi:hypothetical protein
MQPNPIENSIVGQIFDQIIDLDALYKRDNSAINWFFSALTDVMILVGDLSVQFIGAYFDGDVETIYGVRLALFTEEFLITMNAKVDSGEAEHTTQARRRSDLRVLKVASDIGTSGDWGSEVEPDKIRVDLEYGDGERLELVGIRKANHKQYKELLAMLPLLRADMAPRTS